MSALPPQPPQVSPAPVSLPPPVPEQGDATGGIIPYKNPHALIAYYLGIFSIIPMIGCLLGAVALGLGISGLKRRKKNPIIRGSVHAWIGIIGGGLSVAVHLFFFLLMVTAVSRAR